MREALTPLLGAALMNYAMNNRIPEPIGNRHPIMAPHGCYRAKGNDKWIVIAVSSDEEWRALCCVMGNPPWSREERFANVSGRLANQDELDKLIGHWTIGYDHIELAEMLQAHGIKAGAVLNAADLVNDPHLKERGFFEEIEHPEAGKHIMPGISWKMSRTPGRIERPAPCFSEHNRYVFGELLDMSDEEIEQLAQEGVTAEAPYTEI
jgi:crotonobetainyl-CoA:carnitine CoA-transferase CaiB-like acyl-CoA transferase